MGLVGYYVGCAAAGVTARYLQVVVRSALKPFREEASPERR